MVIILNGEKKVCSVVTVAELIEEFNLNKKNCLVELNKKVLKPEEFDMALQEGDEIELMRFVGGG